MLDLKGKKAFIAGIGDDQGYGWAIAKELAEAGCEIILGVWPPIYKIFQTSLNSGKFEESSKLLSGGSMKFLKVFPMDAAFDTLEEIPDEIKENKRYKDLGAFTISEIAKQVSEEFGTIDILVHSLANSPEIKNSLMNTSRAGYLAALSASSYSLISMVRNFGPIMTVGGAVLSMTYLASEKAIPGYGGGMSSAKAALESDTRSLAYEVGRLYGIRINTISAGPLRSRAARAIGFIDKMIEYSKANAPLAKYLDASEVAKPAAFLLSPAASAITGTIIYVDNGLHIMGLAMDSQSMKDEAPVEACETN
jgi:enoyl-[acyl-carrier protein] reductase I